MLRLHAKSPDDGAIEKYLKSLQHVSRFCMAPVYLGFRVEDSTPRADVTICQPCGFRPVQVLFQCGHKMICRNCAASLQDCPSCGTPIQLILQDPRVEPRSVKLHIKEDVFKITPARAETECKDIVENIVERYISGNPACSTVQIANQLELPLELVELVTHLRATVDAIEVSSDNFVNGLDQYVVQQTNARDGNQKKQASAPDAESQQNKAQPRTQDQAGVQKIAALLFADKESMGTPTRPFKPAMNFQLDESGDFRQQFSGIEAEDEDAGVGELSEIPSVAALRARVDLLEKDNTMLRQQLRAKQEELNVHEEKRQAFLLGIEKERREAERKASAALEALKQASHDELEYYRRETAELISALRASGQSVVVQKYQRGSWKALPSIVQLQDLVATPARPPAQLIMSAETPEMRLSGGATLDEVSICPAAVIGRGSPARQQRQGSPASRKRNGTLSVHVWPEAEYVAMPGRRE